MSKATIKAIRETLNNAAEVSLSGMDVNYKFGYLDSSLNWISTLLDIEEEFHGE